MSFKRLICLTTAILGVSIAALGAGNATAYAETYPWCTQGDTLHCYYMNRAQCEETVDYHGFCVTNPDYRQNRT